MLTKVDKDGICWKLWWTL